MYISTIAFIGKLDISKGKYQWKYEDLYKDGKYTSFEETQFLNQDNVLFKSICMMHDEIVDSIIVDDQTGKMWF